MVDPSRDLESEETGLNLFDDKATAAGSFPTSMLGYDRHAVDTYVREVEHQVSDLKQRERALRREMAFIRAEVGETDFERLGMHATGLLKAAEAQARDIVERAEHEAERIVTEARRSATSLRESAQQEADDIRLTGLASLRQLRSEQAAAGQSALAKARADAERTVEDGQNQRTALIAGARTEAAGIVEAGRAEAARLLAAAERDASSIREETQREAERSLAETSRAAQEAAEALAERLRTNEAESERAAAAVAEARDEAATIRQGALAEAEELRVGAHREAEMIMTHARNKAAEVLTQLEERVEWRKEQLQRSVSTLEARKRTVLAQLANLRALTEQSHREFGPDAALFEDEGDELAPPVDEAASDEPTDRVADDETTMIVTPPAESGPAVGDSR